MGTDKQLLMKGIQTLAMSLLFVVLGPGFLWQASKNKEHFLFIPVLIVGLILFFCAIYFGFKGINRVMEAVFGKKKKKKKK
ncbi:MAG: DUF6095 family protein [Leeuwenhoekiella sp.]